MPPEGETIFLFGAGVSKPAGIPLLKDMTNGFLANPSKYKDSSDSHSKKTEAQISEPIEILCQVSTEYFHRLDLECLLFLIAKLHDNDSRDLFIGKFPILKRLDGNILSEIRDLIISYIRATCEVHDKNVDYLWPLAGLSEGKKMKIFSLNYDTTLETYCEKAGLSYSDGFAPYWDIRSFEEADIEIFKLHGSLCWLGNDDCKFIKVPLKGQKTNRLAYLTDQAALQTIIFPTSEKIMQSELYHWLYYKFSSELSKAKTCVAVGYSFSNRQVIGHIRSALNRNPSLWLVIVDPKASQIKQRLFQSLGEGSNDDYIDFRVVAVNIGVKEAITDRLLHHHLRRLDNTRIEEDKVWKNQSHARARLDHEWLPVMQSYVEVGHYDRVAKIYNKLSEQDFDDIVGKPDEVIECLLGPLSLKCMVESYRSHITCSQIWSNLFLQYCLAVENAAFQGYDLLVPYNPSKNADLLFWVKHKGFDYDDPPRQAVMRKSAESLLDYAQNNEKEEEVAFVVDKFIKTLDHITTWKDNNPELKRMTAGDFLQVYSAQDLGLYKWAAKIVECLYREFPRSQVHPPARLGKSVKQQKL